MFNKKRIWFSLVLLIAVLIPTGSARYSGQNSDGSRADGTAPPAPPIPNAIDNEQRLSADGTAPPAPPIPWKYSSIEV